MPPVRPLVLLDRRSAGSHHGLAERLSVIGEHVFASGQECFGFPALADADALTEC